MLAGSALESESDLLGLLGLSLQDGLGLTSETLLLSGIPSVSLRLLVILAFLVLSHLLFGVFFALLAKSVSGLGSVHLYITNIHQCKSSIIRSLSHVSEVLGVTTDGMRWRDLSRMSMACEKV